MKTNNIYYIFKLKNDFEIKHSKNSAYSLRAHANFLGLDSSVLSAILKGKRDLPYKYAEEICKKLKLTETENKSFLFSVKYQKNKRKSKLLSSDKIAHEKILDEQRHYNVISKWEYYTVLNLIKLNNFKSNHMWMAKKLGIPVVKLEKIIEELLKIGLMEKDKNGDYKRTVSKLNTTQDLYSKALRESHKQIFDIAKEKIDTVSINKRFYSNSTIPISINKIQIAKEIIRDFRDKLCDLLKDDDCSEVYNLTVGLFPLTNVDDNLSEENNEILQ